MTRFFNFFRNFFRIPLLEGLLARFTQGKDPSSFICKIVPNPYQYPSRTIRRIMRHGIFLKVDISDYIGHYIYYGFKDASQEALFGLCKDDSYVLDIGTNIGYSLLRMASLAPLGQLAGFEPDPVNHAQSVSNMSLNPAMRNLRVFNVGLGDSTMLAEIEVRTPGNRGANRVAAGDGGNVVISITTLDAIFPNLNWDRLTLVKLDVEGYELKALRGAESTLKAFYPILFIEVNDINLIHQSSSARELIQYLLSIGYTDIRDAATGRAIALDTDLTHQHLDVIATREVLRS